jgi:hypothetical protein
MPYSPAVFRCVIVGLGFVMSGCATTPIPPVQLQNYALLVPQDIYGNGAAVTEIDRGPNRVALQMTAEGSHILPGVSTRPGVNVLPGRHTVQVNVCHASSTQSCTPDTYVFEAKPGVAYVLRGPMQTIVMLDRFKKSHLGELYSVSQHEFVSDQVWKAMQRNELTAAANASLQISEQRQRDQSMIRKVGAHVCQEVGRNIIYTGYVEQVADDKLKIRIAEAHFKGNPSLRPSAFTATTVWDSPMQWDLCR